jgi:hypothetical protein
VVTFLSRFFIVKLKEKVYGSSMSTESLYAVEIVGSLEREREISLGFRV